MTTPDDLTDPLADAQIAARLCAIDPVGLGGMVLRGGGEARDAVVAVLRAGLGEDAPLRRLPVHADDEAVFGGLDLTATLASGAAVRRRGLLAAADGGLVVAPMAERMAGATAARIAAAIDTGEVEGRAARFALVLLDDGVEADERPPAALAERVAFWVDMTAAPSRRAAPFPDDLPSPPTSSGIRHDPDLPAAAPAGARVAGQPRHGGDAAVSEAHMNALAATAAVLGIDTARAPLFALRAAKAAAILAGRDAIADEDVALAARLVLSPRATRVPEMPETAPPPEPPSPETGDPADSDEQRGEPAPLDDIVLAAALAALPPDVLANLAAGATRRGTTRSSGGGERRASAARGRPLGARAGLPGGGRRLSLIDTLRAAAPWQRLRGGEAGRVAIRRDDLRIRRFESRAEAVTIFAVDASGSAALARLAEAKGAVELLLAQAYVKRAQVALLAFSGTGAEVLLPPTRSLARARRCLAELPGGGGTPLAAGLIAARDLADAARARGRTPFLVVLTDGRANIAAEGGSGRAAAQADAENAARAIGAAGIAGAFVDISPRPRPEGAALAAAMGARYLPLPRADAATMHAAVVEAQRA